MFGNGELIAEILDTTEVGGRIVRFYYEGVFEEVLDKLGEMPVPPYIKKKIKKIKTDTKLFTQNMKVLQLLLLQGFISQKSY